LTEQADHTLSSLVEQLAERASKGEGIRVATIQEIAGQRFAGPMLFFPAMVVVSPLSLIPTLPTMIAVTVILIAAQIILGRKTIWLPQKLNNASMSPERTLKVVEFMRPAAGWIGKFCKPRLRFLVNPLGIRLAAAVCVLVALTMPPLEFFPGASTAAGVVIATFGLSITLQDGLLLLLALALIYGAAAMFIWLVF
jgi:hypothetical protein